jgi:hypothetical protein
MGCGCAWGRRKYFDEDEVEWFEAKAAEAGVCGPFGRWRGTELLFLGNMSVCLVCLLAFSPCVVVVVAAALKINGNAGVFFKRLFLSMLCGIS